MKINDSSHREDKTTQTDNDDLVDPVRYKIKEIFNYIELLQRSLKDIIKYQKDLDERLRILEYYNDFETDE